MSDTGTAPMLQTMTTFPIAGPAGRQSPPVLNQASIIPSVPLPVIPPPPIPLHSKHYQTVLASVAKEDEVLNNNSTGEIAAYPPATDPNLNPNSKEFYPISNGINTATTNVGDDVSSNGEVDECAEVLEDLDLRKDEKNHDKRSPTDILVDRNHEDVKVLKRSVAGNIAPIDQNSTVVVEEGNNPIEPIVEQKNESAVNAAGDCNQDVDAAEKSVLTTGIQNEGNARHILYY